MIVRCLDVETLGLAADDGVCEIGWCDLAIDDGAFSIGAPQGRFVNPGKPIPPTASGIHHIVDADVVDASPLSDVLGEVLQGPPAAIAAHHAKFERQFIATEIPWVCSYKAAVTLAPHAPDHKLQTLRYWANLAVDPVLASPSHRAAPDAYVCAHLLARMLAKMSLASMIEVSARPVLLPRLTFGEHAMKPIAEVPWTYFDWIVNKSKGPWDEDVLHTAKHYLAEARAA